MSKKCWTARRSSETLGRFWLNGTLKIASSTAPHPLRSSFCTHSKGMWSNLGPMGSKVRNLWIEWMNGFTIQCWRIYPMLEAEKRTRSFNTSPIEKTKVQTFKISPIFENMVLGAELGTYCWRLQEWSQSSPPTSASRFPHQSPRPESKRRRKLDRNLVHHSTKASIGWGLLFSYFDLSPNVGVTQKCYFSAIEQIAQDLLLIGCVPGVDSNPQFHPVVGLSKDMWQFLLPKHHVNSPFLVA